MMAGLPVTLSELRQVRLRAAICFFCAKGALMQKVSVIVPIYNCAEYVAQCVESIRAQTLGDFEAICVDDGSGDGSLDAARAAAADDARFSFFELPENRGQSAARNVALDHAQGEYLVLLDADDYLVPEALAKLVARADAQQLDDLYFSGRAFFEDEGARRLVPEDYGNRPSFEGVASGMELFAYFEQRDAFFAQAPLRMVRRDLVERAHIRFCEGIIHEDLLFTMQTLVESRRSSFLNEELYMRRVHRGSTMAQPRRTVENVRGHFVCLQRMEHWMREHPECLGGDFAQAMAHRFAAYRALMAHDWKLELTEGERAGFLDSLSPLERFEFFSTVVYPDTYVQDVYDSKTYRLGDAIASFPRAVAERLSSARRRGRES